MGERNPRFNRIGNLPFLSSTEKPHLLKSSPTSVYPASFCPTKPNDHRSKTTKRGNSAPSPGESHCSECPEVPPFLPFFPEARTFISSDHCKQPYSTASTFLEQPNDRCIPEYPRKRQSSLSIPNLEIPTPQTIANHREQAHIQLHVYLDTQRSPTPKPTERGNSLIFAECWYSTYRKPALIHPFPSSPYPERDEKPRLVKIPNLPPSIV